MSVGLKVPSLELSSPDGQMTAAASLLFDTDALYDVGSVAARVREVVDSLNVYVSSTLNKTTDTAPAALTLNANPVLQASGIYVFEMFMMTTAGAAGGVKFDLSGGSVTITACRWSADFGRSGGFTSSTAVTALSTAIGSTTATLSAIIRGYLQVNVGGTLIPRFAQNVSDGTQCSVFQGSSIHIKRVTT